MKIYLIRHGESLANLGLVSADFSMDNQNTLSKKGENQIQAIIPAFQNCNIVRIFSSPMKRAVKSAEILQSSLVNKPKIIIDNRLKEIDYGILIEIILRCKISPRNKLPAIKKFALVVEKIYVKFWRGF